MTQTSRRAWPAVGWETWAAAVCAGAVFLTCTLNSLQWLGRPFPGFFLWENLFVPAVGVTDWTGNQAGIPYGARVRSADGRRVTRAGDVYATAARVPVGTPISYTFGAVRGGGEATLAVATMRFGWSDYWLTLGNYLLCGALLTLLGFAVYILRPDAPAARAMLCAGGAWGLYFTTAADIFGPAWFRPLCLMLQALSPVALLHLALTFPVQRRVVRRHPCLLPALYAAAAVIGIADNLVFTRWFGALLVLNRLHALASAAGGAALIGLLAHGFFVPPSAAARQRIKIAALGGAAAFLVPSAGAATFSLLGIAFPLNFLTLPLALFPLAIGYAIVKHDLFEVDAFIRRSVAWAILTALIAALYVGGISASELLLTGHSSRAAQVLFLLATVALFNPLRSRVQAGVDFVFAREPYDYPRTVAEASQALAVLHDLDAVVGLLLRTVTETMHIGFGAVWLRADAGYRLHAVAGRDTTAALPEAIDAASELVRRLEAHTQVIVDGAGDDGALGRAVHELGATLVVPMAFERRLTGFLALGAKASRRFYSREDLALLRTVANQGAVAVQNARSYRALAEATEELRAAQSRLIEAERFAAIGELSAAVAHGIRNPLAGIKAAAQLGRLDVAPTHPLAETLTDIVGEADKLEARIRMLLDFAKPFEPHPAACRLDDIVTTAVASLRPQMAMHGITLTTELDGELPAVEVDYVQIEQVLLVLLSNAVEAMPGGGHITVHTRSRGSRVAVEVCDTGPGIPPEQMARVFALFFTTKSSGTGLGLAVAKKIVERHAGSITVRSAPGRGACFTVELPVRPPAPVT